LARTDLTKTIAPGHYASQGQSITFEAGDAVNGNQFTATGKELVIAHNTDGATAYAITIHSTPDPYNRTGDIEGYNIPAGGYAVLGPFPRIGWMQSDGKVYIDVENAAIELAVIVLP